MPKLIYMCVCVCFCVWGEACNFLQFRLDFARVYTSMLLDGANSTCARISLRKWRSCRLMLHCMTDCSLRLTGSYDPRFVYRKSQLILWPSKMEITHVKPSVYLWSGNSFQWLIKTPHILVMVKMNQFKKYSRTNSGTNSGTNYSN